MILRNTSSSKNINSKNSHQKKFVTGKSNLNENEVGSLDHLFYDQKSDPEKIPRVRRLIQIFKSLASSYQK